MNPEYEVKELPDDEELIPNAIEPEVEPVAPKLNRGKLPRWMQDRSKYGPHQGKREAARRLRQKRLAVWRWLDRRTRFEIEKILELDQPHRIEPVPTEEDMAAVRSAADRMRDEYWHPSFNRPSASTTEDRQDPPATETV